VRNRRIALRSATVLSAAIALQGCHQRAANSAACEPVPAQSAREMPLDQLAGVYGVTFIASAGPRSGQTTSGRLVLRRQDAGLVSVPHSDTNVIVQQPTIGQLDLALDAVGATPMGDPMAINDSMPGVGFYVTRLRNGDVTGVIARVGSGSNARGQMLFDGGYFALYIRHIAPDRILGGWASAPGGMGEEARGHFCAMRVAAGN
jgi:hypothetical protein